MTSLRQALYGIALLGAIALLIWSQSLRIDVAEKNVELAEGEASQANARAQRSEVVSGELRNTLASERQAQTKLRGTQDQLRQDLAGRQRTIEELKHENQELRLWAEQPLPDAARRLRDRPAITGAGAYRDWLSGRGAVRAVGDESKQ
jgi:LysB family phage lysis regulatory protein